MLWHGVSMLPWAAEPSPLAPWGRPGSGGAAEGCDTVLAPFPSRALGMALVPRSTGCSCAGRLGEGSGSAGGRVPAEGPVPAGGRVPAGGSVAGLWGGRDVLHAPFHSSAAAMRPWALSCRTQVIFLTLG